MNAAALRVAERDADFAQIVEAIPQIVWMSRASGVIEYVNRLGIDYTGVPLRTQCRWGWPSVIHLDDVWRVQSVWEDTIRTNAPHRLECQIRRADGKFRWHDFRRLPIRGSDGQVLKWIGTAIEIEEQKQLEFELRKSQRGTAEAVRLLETLQANAPVGLGFVDREFRIVRMNEPLAAINGAPVEQLIGRRVADVVPNLWPQLQHVYQEVLDTQRPVINLEVSGETLADPGRPHYYLASYYPVCVDQEPIGVGIVVADITERKEAELARTQLFHAAVGAVAATVEARDAYTSGHQRRVAVLSVGIATELGLDADTIEGIRVAAEIHDLGKISIPAEILARPTKLRAAEFELIKGHSLAGYEIASKIPFPWPVADMILQHHERHDGSGYPDGIRGDQILLGARIIAVADVVEAMASHRPYRPAKGIANAVAEIERGRGTLYDPDVADACIRLHRQERLVLDEPD